MWWGGSGRAEVVGKVVYGGGGEVWVGGDGGCGSCGRWGKGVITCITFCWLSAPDVWRSYTSCYWKAVINVRRC